MRKRVVAGVAGLLAATVACTDEAPGGTAESQRTAASPSGDDRDVEVELRPAATSAPLGEPFELVVALRNRGARSVTSAIHLELTPPQGEPMPFYTTSLFVPAGEEVTEPVRVTPAQWFADLGRYTVAATLGGEREGGSDDEGDDDDRASIKFEVTRPEVSVPTFEDVTEAAGVLTSVPEATCGRFSNGAAWGDVDGDGDLDLFVTRLDEPSQLFVNTGDGTFTDESSVRGLAIPDTNGAAFADYDNDGDSDLVVARDASDLLLRNDGSGRFSDVSESARIGDDGYRGMNASWGDFDGDGHLDLYVTNYMTCTGEWATAEEIIAQVAYYPDTLYHNEGDGTFTDVTTALEHDPDTYDDGTTMGAGFGAAWLDYDDDGRLDLYLANDFVGPAPDHNRLWRNDGAGGGAAGWSFTDVSVASGTAFFMNTMGIGVGDFDRDRDLDLALSNIGANKLVRNDGAGTFVEEPTGAGMARPTQRSDYSSITWGTHFHDLNLDGWEDLYLAAGNLFDGSPDAIGPQPDEVYVGDGTGERFLDVSAATGAADPGDSKGVAFADYDRDGDLDMFVINQGGTPHLYRNSTPVGDRHWLQVDVVGTTSSRDACGARIVLTVVGRAMTRQVSCGSGAGGSGSQHAVHFGLGAATSVESLEVAWPSGVRQVIDVDDVAVDTFVTVEEPAV